jgi:hypothetical protein
MKLEMQVDLLYYYPPEHSAAAESVASCSCDLLRGSAWFDRPILSLLSNDKMMSGDGGRVGQGRYGSSSAGLGLPPLFLFQPGVVRIQLLNGLMSWKNQARVPLLSHFNFKGRTMLEHVH